MVTYFDELEDYVQILYNGKVFHIDFKKPFFCIYMDKKELYKDILEKTSKRPTYDEKINKFVS